MGCNAVGGIAKTYEKGLSFFHDLSWIAGLNSDFRNILGAAAAVNKL